MATIQEKLTNVKASMSMSLNNYDEVIDCWFDAIISNKNLLLISDPGEGKTMFYNEFLKHVDEIVSKEKFGFYALFHSHFKPEDELGPMDIQQFNQGKYTRCIDNYVADKRCIFAMMDELPRAGSVKTINMTLFNERIVKIGNQIVNSNIISFIAGVNSEMKNPDDDAINRRFLLRRVLPTITETEVIDFLKSKGTRQKAKDNPATATISIKDLAQAKAETKLIANTEATKEAYEAAQHVIQLLLKEKIKVSRRTLDWWMDVAACATWFDGRTRIDTQDLNCGKDILWLFIEEQKAVNKIINEVVNTELDAFYRKLENIKLLASPVMNEEESDLKKIRPIADGIKKQKEEFSKMSVSKRNESEFKRVGKEIEKIHRELVTKCTAIFQGNA